MKKENKLYCRVSKYPNYYLAIYGLINNKTIPLFCGICKNIILYTSVELDNSNIVSFKRDSSLKMIDVIVKL